jgi:hypothetical protein
MVRSIRFPGRCFLLLVSVITIAGCANLLSPWRPPSDDGRFGGQDTPRRPEVQERIKLQASLMTFADRFASQVAEDTMVLERRVTSPELRLKLARDRLYYLASLYDIVAGPYVGVALFDAVVLVSLTRMVWEEHWVPKVFGDLAEPILTRYRSLEEDIWSIADRYLTPDQAQALREVIIAWRKDNPDKISVSHIRFDDFGALGRKPTFEAARKPGGLLAPVSEATEAVDEIRLLGERVMFLLSRSQLLVNFQIEVAFREWVTQPEMGRLLSDLHDLRNVSDHYAEIMAELPRELRETSDVTIAKIAARVTKERRETIEQFMTGLSRERQQLLTDITAEEQRLARILPEIRHALDAGTGLMTEVNRTMASVEPLLASMGAEKPYGIAASKNIDDIVDASRQVTAMVNALERLLMSPGWREQTPRLTEAIQRLETSSRQIMDATFRNIVILILVFMAGLLVTLLVYRWVADILIRGNGRS